MPYERSLQCPDENCPADVTTSCRDKARSKQILISYVRAEAAEHALRLKRSLTRSGFDVFLVSCTVLLCSLAPKTVIIKIYCFDCSVHVMHYCCARKN